MILARYRTQSSNGYARQMSPMQSTAFKPISWAVLAVRPEEQRGWSRVPRVVIDWLDAAHRSSGCRLPVCCVAHG